MCIGLQLVLEKTFVPMVVKHSHGVVNIFPAKKWTEGFFQNQQTDRNGAYHSAIFSSILLFWRSDWESQEMVISAIPFRTKKNVLVEVVHNFFNRFSWINFCAICITLGRNFRILVLVNCKWITVWANVLQKFRTGIPDEIWRVDVTRNLLGEHSETELSSHLVARGGSGRRGELPCKTDWGCLSSPLGCKTRTLASVKVFRTKLLSCIYRRNVCVWNFLFEDNLCSYSGTPIQRSSI